MFEKIATVAMMIIVPLCILFFPRICSALYFAFITISIADGRPGLAMSTLIPYAALLFILLELSPIAGPVWMGRKSFLKNKWTKMIAHFGIMFVVVFGAFIGMSQWGLHNKAENGAVGFLFSFILCPAAGFIVSYIAFALSHIFFTAAEETEKRKQEEERIRQEEAAAEAERAAAEAERQRLAAEAEAKRKAAEAERQRLAAEAEARRLAEIKRLEDNERAILSFWDVLVRDYDVNQYMKQFALGRGHLQLNLNDAIPDVWVRNDDRIKKIEDILRSAGFHVGAAMGGRLIADMIPDSGLEKEGTSPYQFESPFLETVLYSDAPIKLCAANILNASAGRQQISGDGWVLPNEYTYGFHSCIDSMISWANEMTLKYFAEYKKEYEIIKAGLKGEYAVQEILDIHAGAFLVLHDLRLEFPNGSSKPDSVETDTLVLAPNGIFAIEVKNYGESGRYKIVVTSDGNWYKEYPSRWDGELPKRETMSNPFKQNDRHIAFLEKFINELLGRDMGSWAYVENIICIANDEVVLENDPGARQTLTRVSNLYNQLTYDKTQRFTVDELNKIKAALESRSLPGKKYPLQDYSENLNALSQYYNFLIGNRFSVIVAAGLCAKDHPEYLDMIK